MARCIAVASELFASEDAQLQDAWEKSREPKATQHDLINYQYAAAKKWIRRDTVMTPCFEVVKSRLDDITISPKDFARSLRDEASAIEAKPLSMYGIELGTKAVLVIAGTNVSMPTRTLIFILHLALAPVLLLWLGSLYITRYRESLLSAASTNVAQVYPHILNLYPAGPLASPRRKTFSVAGIKSFNAWVYCLIRIALLLMMISVPVGGYIASVMVLGEEDAHWSLYLASTLIGLFALSNLIVEVLPWHYRKFFPWPEDPGRWDA